MNSPHYYLKQKKFSAWKENINISCLFLIISKTSKASSLILYKIISIKHLYCVTSRMYLRIFRLRAHMAILLSITFMACGRGVEVLINNIVKNVDSVWAALVLNINYLYK
uniref:Uncharacterized protein n=1 Tax=Pararge aegeria TaxID=116150 RepID=S4PS62_9NEOP